MKRTLISILLALITDHGSRAAVDKELSRNCKSGLINRAGQLPFSPPRPALQCILRIGEKANS